MEELERFGRVRRVRDVWEDRIMGEGCEGVEEKLREGGYWDVVVGGGEEGVLLTKGSARKEDVLFHFFKFSICIICM